MILNRRTILHAAKAAVVIATLGLAVTLEPAVSWAEPKEIVMWNNPVSESYTKFWKGLVDDFNNAHPDIHVTYAACGHRT